MRRFVCSLVVVVAMGLLTAGSATAQGADFSFTPRVGTPGTTFKATFRAPLLAESYANRPNHDEDYFLTAVGPPGCAAVSEFREAAQVGQRVTMRLTAADVFLPSFRSRWCLGRYVGYVSWVPYDNRSERLIGYFRFRVVRPG